MYTHVKQGREDTWFTIQCFLRKEKGREGKAVVDLDGVEYAGVLGYPMHCFRALNLAEGPSLLLQPMAKTSD